MVEIEGEENAPGHRVVVEEVKRGALRGIAWQPD